jgi:hypothetical protein
VASSSYVARSSRSSDSSVTAGPARLLRALGALAILAMGAVHLQLYLGAEYSSIPTIGTLFLLNFAGAVLLGAVLLMPTERLAGTLGRTVVIAASAAGALMAAVSIAFLLISEQTSLFGFMEDGYRAPIVVALIAEGAAVVLLGGYLLAERASGEAERPG